jgi:hypothetical protein
MQPKKAGPTRVRSCWSSVLTPCRRNVVFYEPYYVAQDWNQWETAEFLIDAMGANYTKVERFTFPRPPIRTRRKSERGGTRAGDNILAGEGGEAAVVAAAANGGGGGARTQ